MQVRSWMAALVVVAGTVGFQRIEVNAQGTSPGQAPQPNGKQTKGQDTAKAKARDESPETPDSYAVKTRAASRRPGPVRLRCPGQSGNRSCRFRPQTSHVEADGAASFLFRDVELRGADRNCMFSITIRESGQEARTVYRGFRIPARTDDPRRGSLPEDTSPAT